MSDFTTVKLTRGTAMGMDVFGKNTTAEEGQYFRASIWYWRPLAEYLEHVAPHLTKKVKYLYSNDGDGLNGKDSLLLADILDKELKAGRTENYIETRKARLAALPDDPCDLCHGTGTRTDEVGVRMGMDQRKECNGCDSTGKVRPWEDHYPMEVEVVQEFATFVRHSGGFAIC